VKTSDGTNLGDLRVMLLAFPAAAAISWKACRGTSGLASNAARAHAGQSGHARTRNVSGRERRARLHGRSVIRMTKWMPPPERAPSSSSANSALL
jgi:hypothetical protein